MNNSLLFSCYLCAHWTIEEASRQIPFKTQLELSILCFYVLDLLQYIAENLRNNHIHILWVINVFWMEGFVFISSNFQWKKQFWDKTSSYLIIHSLVVMAFCNIKSNLVFGITSLSILQLSLPYVMEAGR